MRIRPELVALTLAAPLLCLLPSTPAASSTAPAASSTTPAAAPSPPVLVRVVRATPATEFGVERPSGLAWSPRLGSLLVTEGRRVLQVRAEGRAVAVSRLTRAPQRSTLAVGSGGAMSYLAGSDLVTYAATALRRARPAGHRSSLRMSVADVNGATYDVRGRLVVLDGSTVVRRGTHGRDVRTAVRGLAGHDLVGLTSWPGRNVLFTYDRDTRMLVGFGREGRVVRRFGPAPGEGERRHGPGHRALGRHHRPQIRQEPLPDRRGQRPDVGTARRDLLGCHASRRGSSGDGDARAFGADLRVLSPEPGPVRHRLPAGPRPVRDQRR